MTDRAAVRSPAPQLYIITDRQGTGGRPLATVIERALRGIPRGPAGAALLRVAVQLREKDLPSGPLLALARELRQITRAAGVRLFVNQRVEVALAAGADGVHLGSDGMDVSKVRALSARLEVAVSTHSIANVKVAAAAGASFVVIGPIFQTPSKMGILEPIGLRCLTGRTNVDIPILALGGINASNSHSCMESGFEGVAGIRFVNESVDPAAAIAALSVTLNTTPAR